MSDIPKTDAILALLPGGQTCDPQLVADELRPKIAELERELSAAKDGWTDEICKAQADMRRAEKDINELRAAYLAERALADRLARGLDVSQECHAEGIMITYDDARDADTALREWKEDRK